MTYDFRDRLMAIMRKRGYTAPILEARTGISRRNIANWKNGHYPSVHILIQLADELEVSTDQLLGVNWNDSMFGAALDDARRSGCVTCRHGVCFNGRDTVCTRQDDGVFPKEDLSCWDWRGWSLGGWQ